MCKIWNKVYFYLSGALGGSGGAGGKPGLRSAEFGRWPPWNPLANGGLFNGRSFPLIGWCGGGRCIPEGGSLSKLWTFLLLGRWAKVPGACSVSDVSRVINRSSGCWPRLPRELRANEHCVLQILSLLTASSPNSSIRWRQLFILSDWHWA